jgi:hypothetical protein
MLNGRCNAGILSNSSLPKQDVLSNCCHCHWDRIGEIEDVTRSGSFPVQDGITILDALKAARRNFIKVVEMVVAPGHYGGAGYCNVTVDQYYRFDSVTIRGKDASSRPTIR